VYETLLQKQNFFSLKLIQLTRRVNVLIQHPNFRTEPQKPVTGRLHRALVFFTLSLIGHWVLLCTAWQCQSVIHLLEEPQENQHVHSACLREKPLFSIHSLMTLPFPGFFSVEIFPSVTEEAVQPDSLMAPGGRTGNS